MITQTWRVIQRLEGFGDEDRRNNRNVHRAVGISCREYLEN